MIISGLSINKKKTDMKHFILIILCSLSLTSLYGQPGYKAKKIGFSLGFNSNPCPGIVNSRRYGMDRDIPRGLPIPFSPAAGLEYTISRKVTLGVDASYATNFVGYRVPWVINGHSGGVVYYNADLSLLPQEDFEGSISNGIRILDKNRYVNTLNAGINLKYFFGDYLAPIGNYMQLDIGKIFVSYDKNEKYYYKYKTAVVGTGITPDYQEHETYSLGPSSIGPFPYWSVSYHMRNSIKASRGLFWDMGFGLSWVSRSDLNVKVHPNRQASVIDLFKANSVEDLVSGTTYAYIAKQNFVNFNFRILYIL